MENGGERDISYFGYKEMYIDAKRKIAELKSEEYKKKSEMEIKRMGPLIPAIAKNIKNDMNWFLSIIAAIEWVYRDFDDETSEVLCSMINFLSEEKRKVSQREKEIELEKYKRTIKFLSEVLYKDHWIDVSDKIDGYFKNI